MLRPTPWLLLLALTIGWPAFAGEDPPRTDKDRLQGAWAITAAEEAGKPLPPEVRRQSMAFDGDAYTARAGAQVSEQGTFKLDASRTPKAIELKIVRGPDKGKTQLGIYQLDAGSLKLCLAPPGATERPSRFATSAADRFQLIQLKPVGP